MAALISILEQRRETAMIRTPRIDQRKQKLAALTAELQKRPHIKLSGLARELGMSNTDRIWKILDGTIPTPDNFLDRVCELTGIPLKAVLPPDEYEARRQALRYDMYTEDLDPNERQDW